MNTRKLTAALIAFVFLLTLTVTASDEAEEVPIVVSPNVLNLDSQGTWVTVHAEIAYSIVITEQVDVFLNGLPVDVTKSDNRGELVAKFNLDDVKDIVETGMNELTLTGVTDEGLRFTGTDEVLVIQQSGKR